MGGGGALRRPIHVPKETKCRFKRLNEFKVFVKETNQKLCAKRATEFRQRIPANANIFTEHIEF